MPTIFFDCIHPPKKIRFDLFGSPNMMPHVKTKEIADFSFLTPQHPDFDFRLPAYRDDPQYRTNHNTPVAFTAIEKMKLRSAVTLAMHIVANGYQAMYNYLRFINDQNNHHVIKFKKRVKAWFGNDDLDVIAVVISYMRRMQDTIQDPATFVTFVSELNQRAITCMPDVTMINTPNEPEYEHYTNFNNFAIIPTPYRNASVYRPCFPTSIGMGMRIYIGHLISLTGNNTNNMVKT
jgi:hypothetical protein